LRCLVDFPWPINRRIAGEGSCFYCCFANSNSYWGQAISQSTYEPINGTAQVMAGPELDQMQLILPSLYTATVYNGWFNLTTIPVFVRGVASN